MAKLITLDNLATFKDLMDSSVDEKVAAVDTSEVETATDEEITALFTTEESTDETTTE